MLVDISPLPDFPCEDSSTMGALLHFPARIAIPHRLPSQEGGATMTRAIALTSLIGCVSQGAFCQPEPVPPAFEVASIKPTQSGAPRGGVRVQAGNITGENVTLKQLRS